MFNYTFSDDLKQELSAIPAEYQGAFRAALEQELREGDHTQTDTALLIYLRQRRDDFRNGNYIRPDGRPGMVPLTPEALYEQGFADLLHGDDSAEVVAQTRARRRTRFKVVTIVALAILLVGSAVRARGQRAARANAPSPTIAAAEANLTVTATAPAATLPAVTGADETLKTIGGLGGALTLGRPSSLELYYAASGETIALPIDPSKPTTRGELRYSEAAMVSDNPVAVWVFGTVVNYAVGIPEGMVTTLADGDEVTLNTDTGATLRFTITERWQGANHETGRWLSQNKTGLTLFALPATGEETVAFAFATYDVAGEDAEAQPSYALGQTITLANIGVLRVNAVSYAHTETGDLEATVSGVFSELSARAALDSAETQIPRAIEGVAGRGEDSAESPMNRTVVGASQEAVDSAESTRSAPATQTTPTLLLSLTTAQHQTSVVAASQEADGRWQATFTLPPDAVGQQLLSDIRILPNALATVALGEVPTLIAQLESAIVGTQWYSATQTVVITATVHNPATTSTFLPLDFITLTQGGDANLSVGELLPALPLLVDPGQTLSTTLTVQPTSASIQLQLGVEMWMLSGIPLAHTVDGRP